MTKFTRKAIAVAVVGLLITLLAQISFEFSMIGTGALAFFRAFLIVYLPIVILMAVLVAVFGLVLSPISRGYSLKAIVAVFAIVFCSSGFLHLLGGFPMDMMMLPESGHWERS